MPFHIAAAYGDGFLKYEQPHQCEYTRQSILTISLLWEAIGEKLYKHIHVYKHNRLGPISGQDKKIVVSLPLLQSAKALSRSSRLNFCRITPYENITRKRAPSTSRERYTLGLYALGLKLVDYLPLPA